MLCFVDIQTAFSKVKNCFPSDAIDEGIHFRFASREGVTIIERHRNGQFFYWLLEANESVLIHRSQKSRFKSLHTVGTSITPSAQ